MFEAIAPSYDRLNRWLSFGIDRGWRRRAAEVALDGIDSPRVLDLASGTGDQVVALRERSRSAQIVGLDLSADLLRRSASKVPLDGSRPAVVGAMERLPFRGGSFDAITMAFALRHVESLDELMRACAEVLAPGGRVAFVDMAIPEQGVWAGLYGIYFRHILPRAAVLFGGKRRAYELMVRSVEEFPGWDALERAARGAGLIETGTVPLTGGAARIFSALKPPTKAS